MDILSRLSTRAVVVLALAGCGPAAADVAAGPGPTNYTVQPQPAPGSCHYRTAADGRPGSAGITASTAVQSVPRTVARVIVRC